ncbi:MAG: hypothetical protein HJJLKODD_01607 [Phycisphaerae bacterium]|nr:hypothetical protein [Phycisphaerae bacterium]
MGLFDKVKKKAAGTAAKGQAAGPPPEALPVQFSDAEIKKARQWFQQGKKLYDDRNYDYAIESYVSGLQFWPEAVDEGHIPLRVAAFARREKGGKKPGTMDAMKRSMSGKNPLQGLLNAEWLWAHDPGNLAYMEGMVKNAAKGKYEKTLLFIAPIYFEAIKSEKKLSKERFLMLRDFYNQLGDRCELRQDYGQALLFYQGSLTVLEAVQSFTAPKEDFTNDITTLATKITLLKGKYDGDQGFQGSVRDKGAQADYHDRERMVMDDERLDALVADARKEWEANRNVPAKLLNLVELLCRPERQTMEDQAIALLMGEHDRTNNYSFKMRADDIRMKQLRRRIRDLGGGTDSDALNAARVEQLKYELSTFKERMDIYPTDNRIKFEYGRRLVKARKFDEAIPILQDGRSDPKNRFNCLGLIGRCFFEKGLYSQAIATYEQAISEYEIPDDDTSKDLNYWLARSYEELGKQQEALEVYGKLIQWDYNYKDVRNRLAALEKAR